MHTSPPRVLTLAGLAPALLLADALAGLSGDLGFLAFLVAAEAMAALSAYSEKALEAHSRAAVQEEARKRGREAAAALLLSRLPTYLLSARILRFLSKAALVVGLAWWVLGDRLQGGQTLGLFGPVTLGLVAGVLGLAFALNFVVNDVLMDVLARRAPDRFLVGAQPLLEALRWGSAPLRVPLVLLVRLLLRVSLEAPPQGAREEVRETVVEGRREGALSPAEASMIESVMDLSGRTVAEVLVPRAAVSMLHADTRLPDAIAFVREDGHSRVPVYGRDRDDILGVLYARDLLAHAGLEASAQRTVRELMRPAYFVPETKRLHELLGEMRNRRNHLAIVVNEIRATAGVVSIEDVLETIVGEIRDEGDVEERRAASQDLSRGAVDLDARTSVEDANRVLRLALPVEADYETVGGLLLHRLGKVPRAGERLTLDGVTLTVTEADERRVKRVLVAVDGAGGPGGRGG